MFNDQQDNQQQTNTDIDQVANDITSSDTPSMGLGSNPSAFNPVMPSPSDDVVPATSSSAPPLSHDTSSVSVSSTTSTGDLQSIRDNALQQLSPLVSKLDQSPEEKFKTLMMLIQASDNHDLIKEAYDAANAIPDETTKAEALLAIVNEINYFTSKPA